jgi:hypothetical protein
MLRVYLAALPKIEAPALSPFRFRPGLLYWPPQLAAFIVAAGVNQATDSFLIQRAACKAASVGGLVSPIYESTRREK